MDVFQVSIVAVTVQPIGSVPKRVTLAPCSLRFGKAVQKAHGGSVFPARCLFGERAVIGVMGSCLLA